MSKENIAVHCETEEEWKAVRAILGTKYCKWDEAKRLDPCQYADGSGWGRKSNVPPNYNIIPASEYLKEKEEEFKVGDRVKCIGEKYIDSVMYNVCTILEIHNENGSMKLKEGVEEYWYPKKDFKLVESTNQPKTTKKEESIMAEIRENFITAFPKDTKLAAKMAARFGNQYDNSDRDLLALERDKDELVKILDAEEKAAEKAAKAKK
ncbi:MAG: hypothetical protein KAR06_09375 [Deltaproteobacteria bacterium]|nr:hypothetical protein [Deltaproteobacteria bacterium]